MKKLATLLVMLSLGLFTIGCNGGDAEPVNTGGEAPKAPADDHDHADDMKKDAADTTGGGAEAGAADEGIEVTTPEGVE